MNRNRPYDFIKHKLEHSAEADIDALWNDMNKVLDDKMPQQEEKDRRVLAWVFRAYLSVIIISLVALSVTVIIKYRESKTTSNSDIATKPSSNSYILPITKSSATPSKENISITKKATSKPVSIKASQKKATSVQPQMLKNIPVSLASPVSNIQKKETPHKTLNNSVNTVHKQTLNRNFVYAIHKKENTNQSKNEIVSSTKQKKSDAIKNYVNTDPIITNKVTSEPLPIAIWDSIHIKSINAIEKYIVSTHPVQKISNKQGRGWIFGAAVSYNIPISKQEMTTIDVNGKKNVLIDYLPSVSAQYHFNNKLYLQTQFQFISPQYTPSVQLANKTTQQGWGKKSESFITLNKLYYLNLPVSVHYSPKEHLYVGMGIQYSYLKKSILTNENCTWDWAPNGWIMTSDTKTVYVKSNPHKELSNANANSNAGGNGNGGGNGGNPNNQPVALTQVDTVARSFRSNDWRLLADINYQYHRFNLGASFNIGLDKYISQSSGSMNQKIADRNESVFIYLKYNFLDLRRKK